MNSAQPGISQTVGSNFDCRCGLLDGAAQWRPAGGRHAVEERRRDGRRRFGRAVRLFHDGPYRTAAQVDPSVRERVREMQLRAFSMSEPDGAEVLKLSPPAIGRLAELRVPTLIVAGDLDLPEKLAVAERLAAEIPDAKKQIISDVAHMVNMEKPAEFNRIVLDFLRAA